MTVAHSITSLARATNTSRQRNPEQRRRLEIDGHIKARRLLDRNVSDFGSLEDFGDVRGSLPMHGDEIGAVRQESSRLHVGPEDEHRGHPVLNRQLRDLGARGREMRARQDEQRLC